jgi:hypothetical protein
MLLRYYPMIENMQRDGRRDCKKETPISRGEKK